MFRKLIEYIQFRIILRRRLKEIKSKDPHIYK
jgi:hypothetical protein